MLKSFSFTKTKKPMYMSRVRRSKSLRIVNGEVKEYWTSLDVDVTLSDGESPEEAAIMAENFVNTEHKKSLLEAKAKKNGYGGTATDVPYSNTGMEDATKIVWEAVVKKLNEFELREDAQSYLDTTEFKLTIEAKKIVNAKPSKNK